MVLPESVWNQADRKFEIVFEFIVHLNHNIYQNQYPKNYNKSTVWDGIYSTLSVEFIHKFSKLKVFFSLVINCVNVIYCDIFFFLYFILYIYNLIRLWIINSKLI